MVDGIGLDLFADFDRRSHRFGYVAEDRRHLLAGFEPLLLGVEHSLGIVEVLAGREADQPVVRLGVVFVHEVHVVGTDQTDAVFRGQSAQMLVHFELHRIGFVVGPLDGGLVQLQFEVIVVAEEFLCHRIASSAFCMSSAVIARGTSPARQAEQQISPSWYFSNSTRSVRGRM